MADNVDVEALLAMGVTEEDLGIAQTDLSLHAPEIAEQNAARKEAKKQPYRVMNNMPVPPGTPDRIARLYRAIPQAKARRFKDLFDTFTNKDGYNVATFSVEMETLTNSKIMQEDLMDMVEHNSVTRNMRSMRGM